LEDQSVITRQVTVAAGVFAPGQIGELTQVVDFALVDAVLAETGRVQQRLRLLPSRVVVYFVIALVLAQGMGYRLVWGQMVAALRQVPGLVNPCAAALGHARRRVGSAPLKQLFTAISGPVAAAGTRGVFYRGMRLVAMDASSLQVPDAARIRAENPKRRGKGMFGYPLVRVSVLIECGTKAVIDAVVGPYRDGETTQAGRLLGAVTAGMLLLCDAGYDSWKLFAQATATGGHVLCRSGADRAPLIGRILDDGSYLAFFGPKLLCMRVIEAWVQITLADGTVRREQWRLITSLLDEHAHPAAALVEIYHRRWQVETTYAHIKSTILDGHVLRSRWPDGIEQEIWALLVAYQATVRIAIDALGTDLDAPRPDRVSFTIAWTTATHQLTLAEAVIADTDPLHGPIAQAVLTNLLPGPRQRIKIRSSKSSSRRYPHNNGTDQHRTQTYTVTIHIEIMEDGLTPHKRR
jgi:hypothetical protein